MTQPTYTTTLPGGDEELKMREVARLMQVSPTPIIKAIEAGLVCDLHLTTIATAAALPVLTAATATNGEAIPVLRVGPATKADPNEQPPRDYYGFHVDLSNEAMTAGFDRHWTPSGMGQVLAAGALIVACGSFVVGLADIGPELNGVQETTGRVWYDANLVGRIKGSDRRVEIVDRDSAHAELARKIVGLRVLGGQGGNITSL